MVREGRCIMRSILVVVGIVISLIVLGVAFPWAKDWIGQSRGDINQGFADKIRSENLVQNAKRDIAKEKISRIGKRAEIMRAEDKLTALQRQRDSFKLKLDGHEAAMALGWEALESSTADPAVVNGKAYSRQEVENDINRRTAACKKLRTQFETADGSCKIMDAAIKEGGAKIMEAMVTLEERDIELDHIAVLLEAGEAMEAVKKFSSSLTDIGVFSEENRHFKEIRDRLARANAEIEFSNLANGNTEFLNYGTDTSKASVPMSEAQEYRQQHLSAQAPAANTTVADAPVV